MTLSLRHSVYLAVGLRKMKTHSRLQMPQELQLMTPERTRPGFLMLEMYCQALRLRETVFACYCNSHFWQLTKACWTEETWYPFVALLWVAKDFLQKKAQFSGYRHACDRVKQATVILLVTAIP